MSYVEIVLISMENNQSQVLKILQPLKKTCGIKNSSEKNLFDR